MSTDETNILAVTLSPSFCLLWISSPSCSHGFSLRGAGAEKGEALLSNLSVSPAWPLPPQRRHYILLVPALLATVPRQQSQGNRAPRQQRAVSPQWSCHWADQRSGTTPRADRDPTDKNSTTAPADRRYSEGGTERMKNME